MTLTFDLEGLGYILLPWLIIGGNMSKSTPYDKLLARYGDLRALQYTIDLECQGHIIFVSHG